MRAETPDVDPDLSAFRRAFAADVLSMGGDWFTYVAMSYLAAPSREPWALLSVAASHTLPRWALAPWAGALCDRFDKRSILWVVQALRAVIVGAMALLALRPSAASLVAIHGLHLVRMALGAVADSALRSALPSLVPEDRLAWAYARSGVAWSVLFCAGVALGGVTVAAVGVAAAFAIDALSYAVAAALLFTLPSIPPIAAPPARATEVSATSLVRAPEHRALLAAIVAKIPAAIVQGALFIAIARYADRAESALHRSAAVLLGALHAARALGAAAGPYAIARRDREDPATRGAALALVAGAFALFALSRDAHRAAALSSLVLVGVGAGASWVHSSAAVATCAPPHARGKIASLELSTHSIAQLSGSFLGCFAFGTTAAISLATAALALLSALSRRR